ncbi:MAG TPA: hypothetical protein GXX54_09175 [Clostridiales bacterium]|nr:hypothetical protein [Clostridiales bacterium]
MTAKEYLQRYLDADRAINAKLEQNVVIEVTYTIPAPPISDNLEVE